jgi:hypothetical protein
MLLAILALGLACGRWTRRITPVADALLFLGVALIVLTQMVAWKTGVSVSLSDLLSGPGSVTR